MLSKSRVDVALVQEARWPAGTSSLRGYTVFSSPSPRGQLGTQMWVKSSLASQVVASNCTSPRCTTVDIALDNCTLKVVSAHAPTETAPPRRVPRFPHLPRLPLRLPSVCGR
eukprot:642007-Prorocentrum_lima.AAC.1